MLTKPMLAQANRLVWLLAGMGTAACVWLLPSILIPANRQPPLFTLAQVVVCGVLVGFGRQGIDVLVTRLLGAALGLPIGLLIGLVAKHNSICQGAQGCFQELVLGVGVLTVLLAAVMVLPALPTTILWRHGTAGLKPELKWPRPTSLGQWVIVAVVGTVLFFGVLLGLGIPLSAP